MRINSDLLRIGVAWAITRCVVMIWWTITPHGSETASDLNRFAHFAVGDGPTQAATWFPWEYPALARLVISTDLGTDVPTYTRAAIVLLLAVDATFTWWLWTRARYGGGNRGVWIWVLLVPLLAAIPYTRYDLLVGVLVAVSLGTATRHPSHSGAVMSLAIALKLWPVILVPLLVAAASRGDRVRVALWSTLPWLVVECAGALLWGSRSAIAPWAWQWDRGVHLESVPAVLAHWASGTRAAIDYQYNAYQLAGWRGLAGVVLFVGVAAIAWLLGRTWQVLANGRLRPDERMAVVAAASLALIAVLLATGKVTSPQYLLWLLAPLALYSGDRVIVPRSVVVLTAAVCILTTMVYPVTYPGLLRDELLPWTALTLRNMGLLGIAGLMLVRWHQITARARPEREASPVLTGGPEQ